MKGRSARGFTVIEMVVAMAVAVILVAGVASAVRSMSDTARRQEILSQTDGQWSRFIDILRRDLRGFSARKSHGAPDIILGAGDAILAEMDTTADGYGVRDSIGAASVSRSCASVFYIARKVGEGFEIYRVEAPGGGLPPAEMHLWRCDQEPILEFFDGQQWLPRWDNSGRPQVGRLTVGGRGVVMGITR